jgi:hypothetical protein
MLGVVVHADVLAYERVVYGVAEELLQVADVDRGGFGRVGGHRLLSGA